MGPLVSRGSCLSGLGYVLLTEVRYPTSDIYYRTGYTVWNSMINSMEYGMVQYGTVLRVQMTARSEDDCARLPLIVALGSELCLREVRYNTV